MQKFLFLVTILKFFENAIVSQPEVREQNTLSKHCCARRVLSYDISFDDVTSGFRLPVPQNWHFDKEIFGFDHGCMVYSCSASKGGQ